ncbi:MAG TPA: PKD domain-containing protein [Thermoplasmata archaeon]|jgi:hypothetical protein|nr:PKD domain-containing protein [Thermoplasmata archaeon]
MFSQPSKLFVLIVIGLMLALSVMGTLGSLVSPPRDPTTGDHTSAGILTTTLSNFTISPTKAYVGQETHFFANASSDVSSELTFVIYFDSRLADSSNNTASPYAVNETGNPGTIHVTHVYDDYGNFSDSVSSYLYVTLYVGDGTHTYKTQKILRIIENTAPTFVMAPGASISDAVRDEPYDLFVELTDPDDDELNVTWDFGDGTPVVTNETGPAKLGVFANQTHAWSFDMDPGVGEVTVYFTLNITADDGQGHQTTRFSTITFYVPYNFYPENITIRASRVVAAPEEVVSFSASATDLEGDALTWTYVFNDTVSNYHSEIIQTERSERNAVVWANTTHVFGSEGTYYVTVYVVDAIDPELVLTRNQSTGLTMTIAENSVPYVSKNITLVSPTGDIILRTGEDSVEVCFSIIAVDTDCDILTVVWDFGDGSEVETNHSEGGLDNVRFYAFHDYNISGIFNVTAEVTDGRSPQEIVRYKLVTVRSENLQPTFKSLILNMSQGTYAEPNTEVSFTIILNDPEFDPLTVSWDFGDNTSLLVVTTSDFDSSGNLTITVHHTYNATGEYTILIRYSDNVVGMGTHNKTYEAFVRVRPELIQEVRIWNWWDFTSLAMVLGAIGVIAAWTVLVGRYRKTLDLHGMTLDEFRIRRKEMRESYKNRMTGASKSERSRLAGEMREKTSELNRMLWHAPEISDGEVVVRDDAEVN